MTSQMATTATSAPSDVRLPGDLVPAHYDVRLQPFMYGDTPSNFSFKVVREREKEREGERERERERVGNPRWL